MREVEPVVLEGRFIRLEPLERRYEAALAAIATSDGDVWRYLRYPLATPDDVHTWLDEALRSQAEGRELPFVTVERATGAVVGSTRIMDIQPPHDTVEIGGTWLGPAWRRTAINTESKYLLLRHIFDDLCCRRVTIKTDLLNTRSQRAIERLGAVREGVLRKHLIVQGGRSRDSVYYSIIDDEWPSVRALLQARLYGA